jgi:hypothetical protein
MPEIVQHTLSALCAVTQDVTLGTNLALLQFMWMLVSGALLPSRGAVFPALQAVGLVPAAVRRAWAALHSGNWHIANLLTAWNEYVLGDQHWQASRYAGYVPKAVDTTAFWRPALHHCQTKHYHPQAGKALPAIVVGLIGRVGRVKGQRVALPTAIVRPATADASETALQATVLAEVTATLADDEMAVLDAGFKIKALQRAGVPRYVLRLADNFTARRNKLPPAHPKGRPTEYGDLVRPLARTYKGKVIPATAPDHTETWTEDGLTFRADYWDDLVLPEVKVNVTAKTFNVAAIYDPRYRTPWLLASPVKLTGAAWRGLYRDRWPIEQIPLAGKQMVGGARQFVFADEARYRLPELTLLAGAVLTYLAATTPAIPTGFWDRQPKPTPGRFRRGLAGQPFPESYALSARLRKKASVFAHLTTGILAHRRTKRVAAT